MADLLCEDVVTVARAARYLNEVIPDANYNPATLWRWMKDGRLAESGERVFLEHARLGRRIVSSKQALSRFAQRLASGCPTSSPNIAQPHSASADPKSELRENGFFGTAGRTNERSSTSSRQTSHPRNPT